jgi:hypothetical protein
MIKEINRDGFDTKLKYTKLIYPECKCGGDCPKFYFNYLGIGARNTGKTFSGVQLLKHYEQNKDMIIDPDGNKYDLKYFLISPTSSANPVYKSLKYLDEDNIYDNYNDKVLQDIITEIDTIRIETEKYLKYKKVYEKASPLSDESIKKLKNEELALLIEHDFEHYNIVYGDVQHKKPIISIIILDDLLGSEAFSRKNASLLKYFLIRNRHKRICFMILSQSMKSIPKDIRLNCNVFFYGAFKNEKMIENDLYEEVSKEFTLKEFIDMFNYATKEQYGALVVDCTREKLKISKNWDKVLEINM